MRFLRRLRYWLGHRSEPAALAEELALHRELIERELRARGIAPEAARDAARRAMGNETYMREEARGVWTWRWLASLEQDLRYGFRALRHAPGFALITIVTLALGVGANSAMFGVVDTLLFRPPPGVRDPASVVRVQVEKPSRDAVAELSDLVSYPDFGDLHDHARGFAGVAAFTGATRAVGEGDAARSELIILASGSYFSVLGAAPALGRLLGSSDDRANAAVPVAVLSWEYWQRAYGGDPKVLGTPIRLGGRPFTVVGVAAKHFVGSDLGAPALWVPLGTAWQLGFDAELTRMRFGIWLSLIARLGPDVAREQATDAARTALLVGREGGAQAVTPEKSAGSDARAPAVRLTSLAGAAATGGDTDGGADRGVPVSLWFLAITAVVLLIACANVANLLLARATHRAHELAVRASMGATRGRLARQLMTESVLLATLGGLAGLVVALGAVALLPRALPLPQLPPLLDVRLLLFTFLITLATIVMFGVAPAVRAARTDVLATLNASTRAGGSRSPMRSVLVVVQIAASVMLLVSAALFLRSLRNVQAIDPGFAADRLLEASRDTRSAPLTRQQSDEFWLRAVERVSKLPGVRAAALGAVLPFEVYMMPVALPDAAGGPLPAQPDFAGTEYFSTLGIALRQGRPFTETDQHPDAAPVVIVNQALARELFDGASPIGRCVRAGPLPRNVTCAEIVGVAADVRYADVTRAATPLFYRPLGAREARGGWGTVLHVRTDGDPAALTDVVQRELRQLDPSLLYVQVQPLTALIAPQLAPWHTGTFLFTVFGVLGLVLAAVGLYGVVALLVAQRTHEMGVRIALGADRRAVVTLLLAQGVQLVAVGLVIGALGAAGASRLFASMMYGVSRVDPIAYLGTAAVLAIVALVAVYIPARRATRVDPLVALRAN